MKPQTVAGDFMRCPATCNTLIKYYGEKRPTIKTPRRGSAMLANL